MPFADRRPDGIDYSQFGVRVPEHANATAVLAALIRTFDEPQLVRMRAAMARAAHLLDYGPEGGLAKMVLARFASVASGEVKAVPASTNTPLPSLRLHA